jgi:hypothetical protein
MSRKEVMSHDCLVMQLSNEMPVFFPSFNTHVESEPFSYWNIFKMVLLTQYNYPEINKIFPY